MGQGRKLRKGPNPLSVIKGKKKIIKKDSKEEKQVKVDKIRRKRKGKRSRELS